jgi:hypothetical protein
MNIIRALLNKLIMTALGEKFDYIKQVSVDNSKRNTRPGESFVDDTTTGVKYDDTARGPVPLEEMDITTDEVELIDQMQVVIQFFLNLLQVTGGILHQINACCTLSHTGEKRCTPMIGKKSEPSRNRNHIQRNRTNIRNQDK